MISLFVPHHHMVEVRGRLISAATACGQTVLRMGIDGGSTISPTKSMHDAFCVVQEGPAFAPAGRALGDVGGGDAQERAEPLQQVPQRRRAARTRPVAGYLTLILRVRNRSGRTLRPDRSSHRSPGRRRSR